MINPFGKLVGVKFFRRLVLLWSMLLITWVIWRTFGDSPPEIVNGTALAAGSVIGLLATAIGFYNHSRHREDMGRDN